MAEKTKQSDAPAKKATFKAEDMLKLGAVPPEKSASNTSDPAPVASDEALRKMKEPDTLSRVLWIIALGLFVLGTLMLLYDLTTAILFWIAGIVIVAFALVTHFLLQKGRL